jgi:hypothetical protein
LKAVVQIPILRYYNHIVQLLKKANIMGYSIRPGTEITDFCPDDTDDKIYLSYGTDLITIMTKAKEKWPKADFADIEIEAEYMHTHAIYHDCYDGSDYTNFIVITYKGK